MQNKTLIFIVVILLVIPFSTAEMVFNRAVSGGEYKTDNNIDFSFSLNSREGLVGIRGVSIIVPQSTCRSRDNITVCIGRINSTDNEHYRVGLKIDFNSAEIRIKRFIPKKIIKWTNFNITIRAENIGKARAGNFVMEITFPPAFKILSSSCPYTGGRVTSKGIIGQGKSMGCNITLRAGRAGRYEIPVKLNYFNAVKNKEDLVKIPVSIREHDLKIESLVSKPEAELGELLYYALILTSKKPVKVNKVRIIMPHFMVLNVSGPGKNLEWSGYVNGTKRFDFKITPDHYGHLEIESIINYTFEGRNFSVRDISAVNITGRPLVIKKYNNKSRTVMLLNREGYELTDIIVLENGTRVAYYDKIPAFSHEDINLSSGNVTLLYITKYGQRIKDEFLFKVSPYHEPRKSTENISNIAENTSFKPARTSDIPLNKSSNTRLFRIGISFLLVIILILIIRRKLNMAKVK